MNREIKFRAWDKKDNKMSDPFEIQEKQLLCGEEYMADVYDLDCGDFEVMQFTGLKDKNGVEIYEGDIIKQNIENRFGSYSEKNVAVFWNEPKASFWTEVPLNDRDAWTIGKNCEVIGNIYQNPGLLK